VECGAIAPYIGCINFVPGEDREDFVCYKHLKAWINNVREMPTKIYQLSYYFPYDDYGYEIWKPDTAEDS
jgi:hypothetical protein